MDRVRPTIGGYQFPFTGSVLTAAQGFADTLALPIGTVAQVIDLTGLGVYKLGSQWAQTGTT